jgi:hypothetical protein
MPLDLGNGGVGVPVRARARRRADKLARSRAAGGTSIAEVQERVISHGPQTAES